MHELNSLTTRIMLDNMNGVSQKPRHVEFRLLSANRASIPHLANLITHALAWAQVKYLRRSAIQATRRANSTHLLGEDA